jgi:hypothetical protein
MWQATPVRTATCAAPQVQASRGGRARAPPINSLRPTHRAAVLACACGAR